MATECRRTLQIIHQGMTMPQNHHELCVVSADELPAYWLEENVHKGKLRRPDADKIWLGWKNGDWLEGEEQERLETILKSLLGNVANVRVAADTPRLLAAFRGFGKFRVSTYRGKHYVIFKGYAGLRSMFQGTRYLIDNPKVIAIGIGRLGIQKAMLAGARLTIVLMGAYRIAEYLLKDESTLTSLIGKLATDILKIGAGSVVGYGAGIALTTMTGFVIGPLVGAIFVGAATSYFLDSIDGKIGGTDKLVAQIESVLLEIRAIDTWGCRLRAASRDAIYSAADSAAEIVIDTIKRSGKETVKRLVGPISYPSPAHLPRFY